MATPSGSATSDSNKDQDEENDNRYECNICFEQAKDAVVSMCGHLFCWPCIHRWMESRPNNTTCPVCKSVIDRERLIPLYGRGSTNQKDPREKIPPRPQGQRQDPPRQEDGFGMDGIHVSFGIGAFPFTMLGGPVFQMFGNGPVRGEQQRPVDPRQRAQEKRLAKILIMVAIFVIILVLFS